MRVAEGISDGPLLIIESRIKMADWAPATGKTIQREGSQTNTPSGKEKETKQSESKEHRKRGE